MNSVNIVKGRTSFDPKMEHFSGFRACVLILSGATEELLLVDGYCESAILA